VARFLRQCGDHWYISDTNMLTIGDCWNVEMIVDMSSCKNPSKQSTLWRKNEISTLQSCVTSKYFVRSMRMMESLFCNRSWIFCMQLRWVDV